MKTIEEKARAYNEALARAKTYLTPDTPDRVDTVGVISTIFPELAESEDENIRKGLIDFVNQYGDKFYGQITKEHVIAWLEKQETSYTKRDVDDAYVKGMAFAKDELEKQGEQNPAEWSEEDEYRLNSCLNILQPKTFVGNTETINTKWLKSLKGRVQPQPKQEWSKKDEAYVLLLDSICESSEAEYYDNPDSIIRKEIVNARLWLKSLRPHNRWKPSDEQMGCLSDAIEHYNSLGYPAPKLKELLDDLKELKGEV